MCRLPRFSAVRRRATLRLVTPTRALGLLLTSGRRVQQVARKVGYAPDHFATPFAAYSGLLPTEARRAGQLSVQLKTFAKHPPRSADVAANCRVVDRWARLHREAIRLHLRAAPDTPIAMLLQDAIGCAPPRRPRPKPRGRHRRQIALSQALLTAEACGSCRARPTKWRLVTRFLPAPLRAARRRRSRAGAAARDGDDELAVVCRRWRWRVRSQLRGAAVLVGDYVPRQRDAALPAVPRPRGTRAECVASS